LSPGHHLGSHLHGAKLRAAWAGSLSQKGQEIQPEVFTLGTEYTWGRARIKSGSNRKMAIIWSGGAKGLRRGFEPWERPKWMVAEGRQNTR
jgi:hypothetical protein